MKSLLSVILLAGLTASAGNLQPQAGGAARTLQFSPAPGDAEIYQARVFDEPLIPIGGEPTAQESKALADALAAYSSRTNLDDFSSLTGFLGSFPQSVWAGSLLLHLGTEYYNYGYYSKALDAWERAWILCRDEANPQVKTQADRALGELARMYSKLGRRGQLEELLNSTASRPLTGPGTQLIHAAQQALWLMRNRPEISFRCGPLALNSILAHSDPQKALNPLIFYSKSSSNGFSLSQVAQLSEELGLNYQMAFRSSGAALIVPAVVHWHAGHYAALLQREGDRFLVEDLTFRGTVHMSSAALDQEASGYFLVPPGPLPVGWRSVSEQEAGSVWGKGVISGQNQKATAPCDGKTGGTGCAKCRGGMTYYTMDTMLVSLNLSDTPVGYNPPLGPVIPFTATYNALEAGQPASFYYSNLGQKWTCNWISYITDNPTFPGGDVSYYVDGGGTFDFSGYNASTASYAPELMSHATLVLTSSNSYELRYPDGSKKEFTQSDGSTGTTRRIFLTELIDPASNSIHLNYDSQLRLTSIVDAIGQSTTFLYTNTVYSNAITGVTDPFGRTAYFQYNSSGLLSQITDVLGLKSQYVYSTNDFISSLITPYGTTTFVSGTTNGVTFLQATDPLGESELLVFNQGSSLPNSVPPAAVPHGMGVFNSFLYARDSFFWDKRAFAEGAWDVTKAKIWHFLHETDTSSESRVLESVQSPLENRVWYNYPGQLINYRSFPGDNWLGNAVIGTTSQPSLVGRVLDDGTTQLYYYQYNLAGNLTNYTDPMGRSFTYLYATNNIDLLQSIMTRNGKNEVQGSITYNSLHLPLTVTDASGQTTVNTYNSHGQILSITNPKGETATFSYSTNGYLSAITGPLQTAGDTVSFTYDAFGRILTTTDTQGYTLTYNYDAADRTTRITHPDGTYEQFVYSNLDLVAFADRLGRWTTNTYNADQQLVETRDPLGRMTAFQWCKCGSLTGITDPMGRTTTWDYDLESRPVAKHFPDGSSITYIYESAIGRLQSRFDEQGQQSFYEYYADNHLKRVSYPNAAIATPVVTWTYDPDYNRVLTMEDGIGTTVYSYNPISSPAALGAGQLASVAGPLPNSTVTYQYDQLGRVTSRAVNGVAMATTYDALSRPTVITNALGTFQQTFVAATSQPASEIYPNGQTNLFAYYGNLGDERLREITHLYPNGSLLSAFGYSYNAAGQITSWTNQWDTLPTRVWLPSYDAADQLTNIASLSGPSAPINYSYSYDTSGNRTLAQSNAVPNQFDYNDLNQITGVTLGPTNSVSYEWDAARRLTAVTQGALRSEFSYDGMGRRARILEMSNGVVTMDHYFLWTGTELCEERDATGAAVTRRFFPQGECIIGAGGTTNLFYTRDHLGSVREALNQAGALQARSDYDPYGQQTVLTDILLPSFAFTGHYQHQPTGLYLTLYRALDPRAGRWLSRDPLAEAAGLNLYAYLGNDPLMGRDPLGEDWTDYIPSERTLEKANNFAAGFADTITFSISGRIRRAIYPCDGVNTKSGYYTAGVAGGVVWQVALTGALGAGKTAAAKSAVVVEEAATEGAAGATAVEAHVEFAELFNYSGAQNGAGAAYSAALEELGADTALEEVVDGGVSGVMRVAEAAEAGEASAEALAAAENYNNAWSAFMGWLQAGGNSANLATKLKALESCRRAFGLAAFP